MIKLIGLKRAVMLAVMLCLNIFVFGTYLMAVYPLHEDAANMLTSINGQISRTSNDIQEIKGVLATYKDSYARYQDLSARGFFSKQDRFEASRLLDELRPRAGLMGYAYNLSPIKTIPSPEAEATQANLIDTTITLERITSTLDNDVYTLADGFAKIFPPHARLSSFEVHRIRAVDAASLKELTKGPLSFIDAKMTIDWLTVVPKQTDAATPANANAFRGR